MIAASPGKGLGKWGEHIVETIHHDYVVTNAAIGSYKQLTEADACKRDVGNIV